MVDSDANIDQSNLDLESLKIPQLHGKYLNIFSDEKLILKKLESDRNVLIKNKWEWYTGRMSQEDLKRLGWDPFPLKIMKQDLDVYLLADEDMIKITAKIDYQKEKVDYLESVLKALNNRNWMIRNAIDWRKFLSGAS
jgi:hypothetical protein